MGSIENRLRRKWQNYCGTQAGNAETNFYSVFEELFKDTEFELVRKPRKFLNLYLDVELSEAELSEIYIPKESIRRHGFQPDCLIRNNATGKEIYVEIKRQDGWVENKTRHDGRGNAHERLCKYFTPGLLKVMRKESGIAAPLLPFWVVFQGDITRDICRVKEIRLWFDGNIANVMFWRNTADPSLIIEHFFSHILPLLE